MEGLYLIGTVRTFVDVADDQPVVRVGGGYETLRHYHQKNKRHFKQTIVNHMENNNMEYDEVVDGLLSGKKKFSNITSSKIYEQPKKKEVAGPAQGMFEEAKESEYGITRHDAKVDFTKD